MDRNDLNEIFDFYGLDIKENEDTDLEVLFIELRKYLLDESEEKNAFLEWNNFQEDKI